MGGRKISSFLNMQILDPLTQPKYRVGFLHLGFRPFFLGSSLFAIATMLWWMAIYSFEWSFQFAQITSQIWHAHEMVYGYALGVIAGFLLTAVKNWTGVQTVHQKPLAALFSLWFLARLLPVVINNVPWWIVAIADLSFSILLIASIGVPLYKARAKAHAAILLIVALFFVGQSLFYSGVAGWVSAGTLLGIYLGFYLVILMILVMGRRVIPFFIEKGVGHPVEIKNYQWVDIATMILFLIYVVLELFHFSLALSSVVAALFVMVQLVRISGWYTPTIWDKPLLWVLLLAYLAIIFGFVLKALSFVIPVSPYLVIHTLAVGGVALVTVGMMARVSLGHTGRNVFEPPASLKAVFSLVIVAGFVRVGLPLVFAENYQLWILISQIIWIIAFTIFLIQFGMYWIKPRVDGRYG